LSGMEEQGGVRQYPYSAGFTLVEIMIVVAIIGLLAMMALPSLQKARIQSQNTAFINDLRIIAGAVETCIIETRAYPSDRNVGSMPPELVPYLTSMNWSKPTPIGGSWDYCGTVWGIKCGIGVYLPSRTAAEMVAIDAKIDDGNLNTGHFRQLNGQYVDIIEQ